MEKLHRIYIEDSEGSFKPELLGFTYASNEREAIDKYLSVNDEMDVMRVYVKAERITIAGYMKLYREARDYLSIFNNLIR